MTSNYDASQVGVPYVRVNQLIINWPDALGGLPSVNIQQCNAVLLADGTVRDLNGLSPIMSQLDFVNNGNTAVSVVDPSTGVATGSNTTLNITFAQVLAIIRQLQLANNP